MRLIGVLAAITLAASCSDGADQRSQWVRIPGGCFQMGSNDHYPEERPTHRTCVGAFDIMTTEVTNEDFAEFVEATGYVTRAETGWDVAAGEAAAGTLPSGSALFSPNKDEQQGNLSWWKFVEGVNWRHPIGPDSEALARSPVVHVTRADAMAYAAWAGGRLPTEAEWEFAARLSKDGAVTDWEDVEAAAIEEKANTWQGVFPVLNSAGDGHKGVAPVGSYPPNAAGVYDMIGNVWEWTSSPFAPSHAARDQQLAGPNGLDFNQPGVPVGVIKGGSFLCARSYCYRFRPTARQAQDLALSTSHIGFRLVRDLDDDVSN